MKHIPLLIVIILFGGMSFSTARQPEPPSDAPYLYWYSDALNAFIIERADGTDSRLFGAGLMPPGTTEVAGPGWSPSGEWFAWYAVSTSRHGAKALQPFILHIAGRQMIDFHERYMDRINMEWSPTADYLLFSGWHTEVVDSANATATGDVLLIDVAENRIIHQIPFIELMNPDYYSGSPDTWRWMPDGQHISVLFSERVRNNEKINYDYKVYYAGIDGSVTTRTFSGQVVGDISPHGLIAYIPPDESALIVLNIMTGEKVNLVDVPFSDQPFTPALSILEWNPVLPFAFFIIEAERPQTVWLLDIENQTTAPILTLETLDNNPDAFLKPSWSPDGRFAAFTIDDRQVASFSIESRQTVLIPDLYDAWSVRWFKDHWLHVEKLNRSDYTIRSGRIYDLERYRTVIEFPFDPPQVASYREFWVAPNLHYGATVYESPAVYNFKEQSWQVIRPHAAKHPLGLSGGSMIDWHRDGAWIITAEYSLFGGGLPGPLRGVIRVEDGFRRDFDVCSDEQCARWLPVQVDPTKLSPPLSEPPFPFPVAILQGQQDYVSHLNWSPDGKYIASAVKHLLRGRIWWNLLWDVESGMIIREIDPPRDETQSQNYQADPVLYWQQADDFEPVVREMDELIPLLLARSPDSKYAVAWIDPSKTVTCVIDATSHEVQFPLENTTNSMESFSYHPVLPLILGVSPGGRIQVWDATTGEKITELPFYAHSIAFSPDGEYVALGMSWNIHIYRAGDILQFIPDQ